MSKDKILEKLGKLEDLINSISKPDDGDDLFPKHWIILLAVKDEVSRTGTATDETLKRMNALWRINKAVQKVGSVEEYEKQVWEEIDECIVGDDMVGASDLIMKSFIKDDGEEHDIATAREMINDRKKAIGRQNKKKGS